MRQYGRKVITSSINQVGKSNGRLLGNKTITTGRTIKYTMILDKKKTRRDQTGWQFFILVKHYATYTTQ